MTISDFTYGLRQFSFSVAGGGRRRFKQQALKYLLGGYFCLTPLVQSAEAPFTDEEIIENTAVKLPIDRIGRFADERDQASVKWGRFAIHDPQTSNLMRDARKTSEQRNRQALAFLAITDPQAYLNVRAGMQTQTKPKTPAQQRKLDEERERDFAAMLNPMAAALESEKKKTPKQRRREALAAYAILSPFEFNVRVNNHKTASLKQKEADAILAFSQPRVFRQQRLRLVKTGSIKEPKSSKDEPADPVRIQPKGKGAEQGSAKGGGR